MTRLDGLRTVQATGIDLTRLWVKKVGEEGRRREGDGEWEGKDGQVGE